jgi:hypothetical protein
MPIMMGLKPRLFVVMMMYSPYVYKTHNGTLMTPKLEKVLCVPAPFAGWHKKQVRFTTPLMLIVFR